MPPSPVVRGALLPFSFLIGRDLRQQLLRERRGRPAERLDELRVPEAVKVIPSLVVKAIDHDLDGIAAGIVVVRGVQWLFGRSLTIREVDAGSCNGCELEIHALNNSVYDVERFGLKFVASPRHADVLLVTDPVTHNMKVALERTYAATPDPKLVVAVGDCGCGCGVFEGSYAVVGAVDCDRAFLPRTCYKNRHAHA